MNELSDFEMGTDSPSFDERPKVIFSEESNMHYRADSIDLLVEQSFKLLKRMIAHHYEHQVPRLKILKSYAEADNTDVMRCRQRRDPLKADHRASHNYGRYISDFITGYLCGMPIKIDSKNDDVKAMIDEINQSSEVDAHHSEIERELSRYGRAYELIYHDSTKLDKVVLSDVMETFVIYDTGIDLEPIASVRYPRISFGRNKEKTCVTLCTDTEIIYFKETSLKKIVLEVDRAYQHGYGYVPIVEFFNNRERRGDYEDVLTQIDLYDAAQSDTANYMTDLVDAMLVISGDLAESNLTPENVRKQRDANTLLLQSGISPDKKQTNTTAQYLYKQYDVSGVEAYKNRLSKDIHKFTCTPDLTDENFSGIQSGEAMKYKIFGLDQMRAIKERFFTKGIMTRCKMIANLRVNLNKMPESALEDVDEITCTFTPNLPKDIAAELAAFTSAGGEISNRELLKTLSFVKDVDEELANIEDERLGSLPRTDTDYLTTSRTIAGTEDGSG